MNALPTIQWTDADEMDLMLQRVRGNPFIILDHIFEAIGASDIPASVGGILAQTEVQTCCVRVLVERMRAARGA